LRNLGNIDQNKKDKDSSKQPKSAADIAIESLAENLTKSNWNGVADFFSSQFKKTENANKAYLSLLDTLALPPRIRPTRTIPSASVTPGKVTPPRNMAYAEKHLLSPTDILYLGDACPVDLNEKTTIPKLGRLLKIALSRGHFPDTVVILLEKGTKKIGGSSDSKKRMTAARLLISAGLAADAGKFLPKIDDSDDPDELDIIANYHLALHAKEPKEGHLGLAWKATQLVLANPKTIQASKESALERAVDLAPKVEEEKGARWLSESFTGDAKLGREVLATIGALTSSGRSEPSSSARLRRLTLQKTATESLLKISKIKLNEWSEILNILALNWLSEASYSYQRDASKTISPRMRWDQYGNMYYENPKVNSMATSSNVPGPIASGELLKVRPNENWIRQIDTDLQPQFSTLYAQLYLKVNEPEEAFPYIQKVSTNYPKTGKRLAEEFLRVWADNHNPNANRNRTYRYGYMYGYNQRANSIPLTRSKQERSLTELANWVSKLQSLPIGEINQDKLAEAFTKIHSRAEVYKMTAITKVFGTFKEMSPKTVAALANTMRVNLATVWRDPKTQQDAKTKRKDDEILAEVMTGYEGIDNILGNTIEAHPEDWRLHLRRACLALDKINFQQESKKSSTYTIDRKNSYEMFSKAAELYISTSSDKEEEETTEAFEHWFYAALGASDLGALRETQLPAPRQIEKIKTALAGLPDKSAERHLARFANALAARISSVKPELKQRYLRHGLSIAGEHEKASEAQKLFNYYNDLTTEIQLVARIDGSSTVGHESPFGVFVDIRHTKEIERESGGFAKYLTNQNNSSYAYNYGRPTQNYREKFEDITRSALSEHFDVMSVTFHDSKVTSRGAGQEGWRVTPYAYVLLKARTPEVDKIPSMQIDLDFLDTGGYVILPIATAQIPIDSKPKIGEPRPTENLKIVQILDEREADQGLLKVEVKASSNGLVPDLDQLLKPSLDNFTRTDSSGGEISIARLDAESKEGSPITERNWILTFTKTQTGTNDSALEFSFPEQATETQEMLFQRYDDADLVATSQTILLEQRYGQKNSKWIGLALLVVLILGAITVILKKRSLASSGNMEKIPDFYIPNEITPFSVLGLLRKINEEKDFPDNVQLQLNESIASVEKQYFDREDERSLNLKDIAEEWVNRAI
ncbi:MAG: hypothetical protein VX407_08350, partial [Verrucomicrobiota bacterium]|nr:hypothetical protein [Verrucomicrobiota bacterium]